MSWNSLTGTQEATQFPALGLLVWTKAPLCVLCSYVRLCERICAHVPAHACRLACPHVCGSLRLASDVFVALYFLRQGLSLSLGLVTLSRLASACLGHPSTPCFSKSQAKLNASPEPSLVPDPYPTELLLQRCEARGHMSFAHFHVLEDRTQDFARGQSRDGLFKEEELQLPLLPW